MEQENRRLRRDLRRVSRENAAKAAVLAERASDKEHVATVRKLRTDNEHLASILAENSKHYAEQEKRMLRMLRTVMSKAKAVGVDLRAVS